MNREEASFILANIDRRVCDDELNEALDMAIKALEQMPVITTAGEGGVIYYPQVEGVTPTVIDTGKQEPCEDAISRQAVLDILKREGRKWGNDYRDWVDAIEEIKNLSSVNPTKTGRWVGADGKPSHLKDEMTTKSVWCSLCGKWLTASDEYSCFGKFCPNCGAKMVEPQESEG